MLRRVLITLDAVGGVWRYAIDVARGLQAQGVACLLVGFGPEPDAAQRAECGRDELIWTHEPLDWMVSEGVALDEGTGMLASLAREWKADVLHLNLPSQACGLAEGCPVVVASHSCVPTWWRAVQGSRSSEARGHGKSSAIRPGSSAPMRLLCPAKATVRRWTRFIGAMPRFHVIHNASSVEAADAPKDKVVLSVGRWWDPGKNGAVLDEAAATIPWPVILAGPLTGPTGQNITFRNARTPGALPHRDVLALMRRSASLCGAIAL